MNINIYFDTLNKFNNVLFFTRNDCKYFVNICVENIDNS